MPDCKSKLHGEVTVTVVIMAAFSFMHRLYKQLHPQREDGPGTIYVHVCIICEYNYIHINWKAEWKDTAIPSSAIPPSVVVVGVCVSLSHCHCVITVLLNPRVLCRIPSSEHPASTTQHYPQFILIYAYIS